MSRLRRHRSRLLDKAAARATAIGTIAPDYAFGLLKLDDLQGAITAARQARDRYNRLLAEADEAQRDFHEREAEANELAIRLFAGVRAQFGDQSPEYGKAGGKPKPARRKRRKPAAAQISGG